MPNPNLCPLKVGDPKVYSLPVGRTRDKLTTETEKFYPAVKRAELGGLVLTAS